MDKNCSFVPKNVHLVLKKQKNCTFYSKNEVFAKKFDQNVQILDKKCSFVPKNVHLVLKNKKLSFLLQKWSFCQTIFTKMYKFWINTVVSYPKMYIWSQTIEKNCTFYTKNEVFTKIFHQNVQILDKKCSFIYKNVYLVPKKQKICTFYTKNEVFAKIFH